MLRGPSGPLFFVSLNLSFVLSTELELMVVEVVEEQVVVLVEVG